MVSEMSGSASEKHVHMYIVIQCGRSSIVEYGTTVSVVDCVKFSVLVNQCVMPSCSLGGSTYPQKKKMPGTHHIMYHFCSTRLGFVVSRYLLGTLGDSHYFLLLMLLSYDMDQGPCSRKCLRTKTCPKTILG
jgi:hypothetical protein